jgi:hypothetical protein
MPDSRQIMESSNQATAAGDEELFDSGILDFEIKWENGTQFVYYVFVYNIYKNEKKKAIYAVHNGDERIRTYADYRDRVEALTRSGAYDGLRHYAFCGDSHAMCFEYLGLRNLLGPNISLFCRIQGTSAYGLGNTSSESGALAQMKGLLHRRIGNPIMVLNMGEVDCRSTLWLKHRAGVPMDELIAKATANYAEFVSWLKAQGYDDIVIAGVHVPVWETDKIWTKNEASREETLDLTLALNRSFRQMADEEDCHYFDINDHLIDMDSRTRKGEFGAIEGEHHLDPEKVAPFFLERLNTLAEVIAGERSHRDD